MPDAPVLLRSPDFLKLWGGQAVSQIGSRISRTALPLTAVLTLGATPLQIGILTGAGAVPVLLFGLFAGVWVDRLRRRLLLIAADFGRALVLGTIPLAAVLHRLTFLHLCLATVLDGALTTLFEVAYRSYVPSLVGPGKLLDANSHLTLTESAAEVVGPGVAGILVQWLTAPVAVAFDALSFLFSMASVWWIRSPEPLPRSVLHAPILREIQEGLAFCWRNRILRALLLHTSSGAFFLGFGSLYILFVIRELGLNAPQLGLLIAAGGAVNLAGALFAPRLIGRIGIGPAMIAAYILVAVAAFVPALARGSVMTCCMILAVAQLGDIAWPIASVGKQTLCQAAAPAALLGRINSAMHLVLHGVLPAGALFAGVIATVIGLRYTVAIGALGLLLSSLFLICSPIRVVRTLPQR